VRILRQSLPSGRKRCDGPFSRHGGKGRQEVVARVSGLELVEEILDRNARAEEDWYAALNCGSQAAEVGHADVGATYFQARSSFFLDAAHSLR
jgi:hypothetical protein